MLPENIDAYRTCEFASLGRDGTPTAWPTSGIRTADGGFLLTTSLGYPQKAFNVRRDGRVALLFSDPTASGLTDPRQILVRGVATCPAEIHTDPSGDLGDFWTMIFERQPKSRRYLDWPMTRLTDFYFMRLLIKVTPSSVTTAPLPAPSRPVAGDLLGSPVLAAYPTAVLATVDETGAPTLVRTTVTAEADGYRPAAPAGPGPASLLVHEHDDVLDRIHNAVVRGTLGTDGVLRPERLIEPGGRRGAGPLAAIRTVRALRAATDRYLEKRSLPRPAVPWPAYRAIRATLSR